MPNVSKQAAKARRDAIAQKLQQVAVAAAQKPATTAASSAATASTSVPVVADAAAEDAGNDVLARQAARANKAGRAFLTPDELSKVKLEREKEEKRANAAAAAASSGGDSADVATANVRSVAAASAGKKQGSSAVTATAGSKKQEQQQAPSSKRRLKQRLRPSVEDLKDAAKFPELVETHDANAPDPRFLLELKQMRNTIPVPLHWDQKSAFMSHTSDRDANSAFEATVLPSWVEKMDIGTAWKTKVGSGALRAESLILPFVAGHPQPRLTGFGDLFYEGKDMRARLHNYRPGVMSERLRMALEMGPLATVPPPWLTGMQVVGRLPPAYPWLKIPGVNAPIPSGARYGKGRHEWGDPPRDPSNANAYLFESVDRANAAVLEAAQRKAAEARWGCAGAAASAPASSARRGFFTMPKQEWEAIQAREKKKRDEEEAAAAAQAAKARMHMLAQHQQAQAQAQAQAAYGPKPGGVPLARPAGAALPVQQQAILQQALVQAGVVRGAPVANAAPQQAFAVDVQTQQHALQQILYQQQQQQQQQRR